MITMQDIKNLCAAAAVTAAMTGAAADAAALEPVSPQPSRPLTFSDPAYAKVQPEEARRMMAAGVVVIDVREPDEFAEERIAGSVNVPLSRFRFGMTLDAQPDKDAQVLVVCRSGVRAEKAARILIASGYKHVFNMYGTSQWPYGLER